MNIYTALCIYRCNELFLYTDPYIYLPIYLPILIYVTIKNQPPQM